MSELSWRTRELDFALAAVSRAARVAASVQRALEDSALSKTDRSPVTVADFAVQAIIGRLLEQEFPEIPLVAEEDSAQLAQPESAAILQRVVDSVGLELPVTSSAEVCRYIDRGGAEPASRFWTLDPIDGTKGFLRGQQYAIALALVEQGTVQLAVVGCPNLAGDGSDAIGGSGSLFVARRGKGSWVQNAGEGDTFRRLRVSSTKDPAKARVMRSVEAGHTDTGDFGLIVERLGVKAEPVLMDSQAKYASMAAGRGDLLLRLLSPRTPDYREKIWDQAAGSLIVEEAGGQVTDLRGRPLDFSQGRTLQRNRGVVASNGHLHEAALEAVRAIHRAAFPAGGIADGRARNGE